MSSPQSLPQNPDAPARLAALLVEQIRKGRRLLLHLRLERLRHRHTRDVLHTAVATLRDYDRQLDRSRATAQSLRDELRRYVAAKMPAPSAPSTPDSTGPRPTSAGVH